VSESDRQKWDERYLAGAYGNRQHPSVYLQQQWEERLAPSLTEQVFASGQSIKVCDVACGAGRNSLYLAAQGCRVDGVDISSKGIERAASVADAKGLTIEWHCVDVLESEQPLPRSQYDLIVVVRFLALERLPQFIAALTSGGYLLVEVHLQWDVAPSPTLVGPSSARYRAAPGALLASIQTCADVKVIDHFEGLIQDPDGDNAAIARMLVRKT